jgi:hypothetical protein
MDLARIFHVQVSAERPKGAMKQVLRLNVGCYAEILKRSKLLLRTGDSNLLSGSIGVARRGGSQGLSESQRHTRRALAATAQESARACLGFRHLRLDGRLLSNSVEKPLVMTMAFML